MSRLLMLAGLLVAGPLWSISASAKCGRGGVQMLPEDGIVSGRGQFAIYAWGELRESVELIGEGRPELVGPAGRVPLRVLEIYRGVRQSAAMLEPTGSLEPEATYRLKAQGVFWDVASPPSKYAMSPIAVRASARPEMEERGPAKWLDGWLIGYGCGPANRALFDTGVWSSRPLLYDVELNLVGDGQGWRNQRFLLQGEGGVLELGSHMCTGSFVLMPGHLYEARITALTPGGQRSPTRTARFVAAHGARDVGDAPPRESHLVRVLTADGAAVPGAGVTITDPQGALSGTTNLEGIVILSRPLATESVARAFHGEHGRAESETTGAETILRFEAGLISGRLVDAKGQALPGHHLFVGADSLRSEPAIVRTDAHGRFFASGRPRGKHWLRRVGGQTQAYVDVQNGMKSVRVVVEPKAAQERPVLEPMRPTGPVMLNLEVVDGAGRPIPGATASIHRDNGPGYSYSLAEAISDDEGRAELVYTQPGRFELSVSARGRPEQRVKVKLSRGERSLRVELVDGLVLDGRVLGGEGTKVSVLRSDGSLLARKTVGRDGQFAPFRVLPGTYRVRAFRNLNHPMMGPVLFVERSVRVGAERARFLLEWPKPEAMLTLDVQGELGAWLELKKTDGCEGEACQQEGAEIEVYNGRAAPIVGLSAGRYSLTVKVEEEPAQHRKLDIKSGSQAIQIP